MLFLMDLDREKYVQLEIIIGLNFGRLWNIRLYKYSTCFDYLEWKKIIFFMVLYRVNERLVKIFMEQNKDKIRLNLVTTILGDIVLDWEKYMKKIIGIMRSILTIREILRIFGQEF